MRSKICRRYIKRWRAGLSVANMRQYLEFIADQRLVMLGCKQFTTQKILLIYGSASTFRDHKFLRTPRLSYQVGIAGEVSFTEAF